VPPDEIDEQAEVEWLERDTREWVLLAYQSDQLTARMTCTYLEAGGVEGRVATNQGRYCVEVPVEMLETALTVYTPSESGVLPAMQEETRKTGIHTGRHLREQLSRQATVEPRRGHFPLGKWVLRIAVLAVLAGLILLLLGD
jgi:hypothetical protein